MIRNNVELSQTLQNCTDSIAFFSLLFDHMPPLIRVSLRRYLNQENPEIEDIVQEAFSAALFKGIHYFKEREMTLEGMEGWFIQTAKHKALTYLKKQKVAAEAAIDDFLETEEIEEQVHPNALIDLGDGLNVEFSDFAGKILNTIHNKQLEIFKLHLEGYSQVEIAEHLNLKVNLVHYHLTEAKAKLAKAVGFYI